LRWAMIQVADPLSLGKEVWIRALEPLPNAMGSKVFAPQDASNLAHADPISGLLFESVGKRAIRPDVAERRRRLLPVRTLARQLHQLAADRYGNPRRSPAA